MKAFVTALAVSGSLIVSTFAQTKIVIKGSDTLGAKLVPQLKDGYLAAGNHVDFEIAAEGSSSAFSNLLTGTADIGMSSREAKKEEFADFIAKGQTLVEHPAGIDMIAVIVNKDNGLRHLTLKQVEGIFTGEITDWSEVGGKPGKISAYTRNTTSGTYKSFQELGMSKRDYGSNTQKMAGSEQIATEVAGNVNGIGYVGLAYAKKKGIKKVKIDRISAKIRNREKYPLARSIYYYTVGEPTGEVKAFLDWATTSEEAAKIVKAVGFIPNP